MGKMSDDLLLLCLISLIGIGLSHGHGNEPKVEIGVYELKQGNFSVKLTNWGATVLSVVLPDRHGKLDDVVLGYDSLSEYMNDTKYMGPIVGRVANRIGGAKFTLNGKLYKLVPNEGKNLLHGGLRGYNRVIWKVSKYQKDGHTPQIVFTYFSYEGDQGFPGDVQVSVTYTITGYNQLSLSMKAKALNKATPVSLAHHIYWNLGGQSSGTILSQKIQIFASKYTPVDKELIPTGEIVSVKSTPYDFLRPRTVGSRINKLQNGYDINYAFDGGSRMKKAVVLWDDKSGRVLELWTNAPGMQFYTSNFLVNVKGKGGVVYQPRSALCLETLGFPDAVNHPNFPSVIVNPGQVYKHFMLFKFSAK